MAARRRSGEAGGAVRRRRHSQGSGGIGNWGSVLPARSPERSPERHRRCIETTCSPLIREEGQERACCEAGSEHGERNNARRRSITPALSVAFGGESLALIGRQVLRPDGISRLRGTYQERTALLEVNQVSDLCGGPGRRVCRSTWLPG